MFLHCIVTLLHIGVFLGLVSSSVLYADSTGAANSATNTTGHDTGHASSSNVATPSSGQSQARKRPAHSADPANISPHSVQVAAVNSPDIDIDMPEVGSFNLSRLDGADGNFSDLSLISNSSSNDGIGFDLDCICDRLPCLARRCVSKPKK